MVMRGKRKVREVAERRSAAEQWRYHERCTGAARARALARLKLLQQIEALIEAGMNKSEAIKAIALVERLGASTIWSWFAAVEGVGRHDRLAYLVPEFRGGGRRAEVDERLYLVAARDYLRPERPSWAASVGRARKEAEAQGLTLPHARTLWRRLHRDYGRAEIAMLRGARMPAWLRARLPANDR